jgi:hypothetical protein
MVRSLRYTRLDKINELDSNVTDVYLLHWLYWGNCGASCASILARKQASRRFVGVTTGGGSLLPPDGACAVMGKNAELGLPFAGMKKVIFAFDVDGTLIDEASKPHYDIVALLKIISKLFKNIRVIIWSGGGKDYAQLWVDRLQLSSCVWRVASKTEWQEIRKLGNVIAIDDIQDTAIGDINLIVKLK